MLNTLNYCCGSTKYVPTETFGVLCSPHPPLATFRFVAVSRWFHLKLISFYLKKKN